MMAGLCTRWLGLCRASGPRWGSAWTPQPRPGPGTQPDNLGPSPGRGPFPGSPGQRTVPEMGGMTIVYGAFIWTSSHDQRLRSLSSALLRSWLRSPVGPEPPSTWSARSEVRTNDLDGHLSVELLGDPSRSLSVAEGRVPAARGAADMIGESSSGGASSGATEQALCGTLGAMGARDREAWLTMRTRRSSL